MALDDARGRIDGIDDQILRLLEERASIVSDVASAKRAQNLPTYDPRREEQILTRLAGQAGRFPADAIRAVYREIMSACLALQEPIRVAYLGPEGSASHAAARRTFGLAARYVEQATMDAVFDAIARDDAAFGVVPVESSLQGSVDHAVDALLDSTVLIRGEVEMDVSPCLLARAGLSSVRRVYGHAQSLARCRVWLAKNLPAAQVVLTSSPAAALHEALADDQAAAVAGRLEAEIYGVPIARERILDEGEDRTRFVVIAREDAPRSGDDKTTMSFSLHDGRGALRRVLEVFDLEGVNLTRIESRPSRQRQKAWDYVFLVDLEGHRDDEPIVRAVTRLQAACPMIRHLGSYPRARQGGSSPP